MWRLYSTFPFVLLQVALHPRRLRRACKLIQMKRLAVCFFQAREFVPLPVGNVCLDYGPQVGKSCLPLGPLS
jgi:hypothetical protein